MNTREVSRTANVGGLRTVGLFVVALALVAGVTLPVAAQQLIAHNTPSYVTWAKNLGAADASQAIEVSIWLNPHNRAEMDQLAKDLYNQTSFVYRHWLKSGDIGARFAPATADAKAVQNFFESHNLKVTRVGPNNFYVRARGTVSDVETAFHVQLNNYKVNGEVLRANDRDPAVDDEVAPLVQSVAGLDTMQFTHPMAQRPAVPGAQPSSSKLSTSALDPNFFSSDCFRGTTTERVDSLGTDGPLPIGTYHGNNYFTNSDSPGCAYTPEQIYTAYNLKGLYAKGFNGAGQTIVIIDWCGSPTVMSDGNFFNRAFGLPLFDSSNFQTIFPTPSLCYSPQQEINLDTEWAHAIAPGAKIVLVAPPTNLIQDVDEAWFYAVNYDLGNVISGSYLTPESLVPHAILNSENMIAELAAMSGISSNFCTGDNGDLSNFTYPPMPPTVAAPADSTYATAIGGVTLALTPTNTVAWQTGWGNNETYVVTIGAVYDPPFLGGFYNGSGGGASGFFPAPSYQSGLGSSWRQLPDISWLADPFSGVPIAWSVGGQTTQFITAAGTSLATPMFSALWAIANQEAGVPLGQASRYLYNMPSDTITDVVQKGSATNVTASVQLSSAVTHNYTADEVSGFSGTYYDALWNLSYLPGNVTVVTFGTDTTLKTGPGWDNVTGLGTPNAQAFADWFAPKK